MKIAINTLPLLRSKAGAERYTFNIINELSKIDHENEYYIIVSPVNEDIYKINASNFFLIKTKINTLSKIKRILYEQCVLPFILKFKKIDVLFCPCNIMPIFSPCKNVTMIFDMHWFIEEEGLNKNRLWYIKNFIRLSALRSDRILTLSESSKQDIIRFTGVFKDKIVITPVGKTPLCFLRDEIGEDYIKKIKEQYGLNRKYMFFLGQLLFRKNVGIAIEALAQIKEEKKVLDFDFVIVGGQKEAFVSLKELAQKRNLENEIKFFGEIEDLQIAALLKDAGVFIYPSLYEGFGIPVLEALYYSVPTITSNVSSLPEVGGDACIYVDPKNVQEVKDAILFLWSNKEFRKNIIAKGLIQAEKFNWKDIAEKTKRELVEL